MQHRWHPPFQPVLSPGKKQTKLDIAQSSQIPSMATTPQEVWQLLGELAQFKAKIVLSPLVIL